MWTHYIVSTVLAGEMIMLAKKSFATKFVTKGNCFVTTFSTHVEVIY